MLLFSDVDVSGVRKTSDGYLVGDARVARTGIQIYRGPEVGRPDMDVVRVFRPEGEVFAKDALHSYAHRPVTNDHPTEMVDSKNWKDHSIGQTGGDVARDGEFVRVPMVLMDAGAIADYESGKRELSMGYRANIVFDSGVTPEGEQYDAIQTDLRMNHLALVARARGGEKLRLGDKTGGIKVAEQQLKTVLVDGLSVQTTDQGAQAIAKLQKDLSDAQASVNEKSDAHAKEIAAKDAEIAKRDAELDDLKGKVLSDSDLDKRVQRRADLIATAKSIQDGDYSGKSDDEIRKSVVSSKIGDAAISGKSNEYINARFDILAEDSKKDPVNSAISQRQLANTNDGGQSAYELRIADAWKGGNK